MWCILLLFVCSCAIYKLISSTWIFLQLNATNLFVFERHVYFICCFVDMKACMCIQIYFINSSGRHIIVSTLGMSLVLTVSLFVAILMFFLFCKRHHRKRRVVMDDHCRTARNHTHHMDFLSVQWGRIVTPNQAGIPILWTIFQPCHGHTATLVLQTEFLVTQDLATSFLPKVHLMLLSLTQALKKFPPSRTANNKGCNCQGWSLKITTETFMSKKCLLVIFLDMATLQMIS